MRKRSEKVRSLSGKINAEFEFKSGGLDRKFHGLHHFFPTLHAQPNLPGPMPVCIGKVDARKNCFYDHFFDHDWKRV